MDDVKQALEALEEGGMLLPANVVDAARSPRSPLHRYFSWDDGVAADKWREEQARQLIRSVTIKVNSANAVVVRAYVSLPADRLHGDGYRKMEDVIDNKFLRRQMLDEIERKIELWEERASAIGLLINFGHFRKEVRSAATKRTNSNERVAEQQAIGDPA